MLRKFVSYSGDGVSDGFVNGVDSLGDVFNIEILTRDMSWFYEDVEAVNITILDSSFSVTPLNWKTLIFSHLFSRILQRFLREMIVRRLKIRLIFFDLDSL